MTITQLQDGIVITVNPPDGNDNGNYTITGWNRDYSEKFRL